LARGPREHRHQLALVAVLAHQHRRQLLADLHQVGQVGDVVFGDQVLDQADALQPRAGAQGLADVGGADAGDLRDGGIGLGRVVDLELHQDAAQVALVAGQRAVQQQRALGAVELQQAGQRVDVLLDQRRLLLQRMRQPVAGDREHRQQVLGLVLGVFVQVEEQRAFLVGAAPDAVPVQELGRGQLLVAAPELVVLAAAAQEFAQARQRGRRPHQVAAGQRQQAIEVAPHVELAALLGGQRQHEVRAHQVEHRRVLQARRGKHLRIERSLDHGGRLQQFGVPGGDTHDNAASGAMEAVAPGCKLPGLDGVAPPQCPMLQLADIRAAAQRVQGQVLRTPCVESQDAVAADHRAGVPEVREPAVHRHLQGTRRLQQAGAADTEERGAASSP
jgi:hypothetical protein